MKDALKLFLFQLQETEGTPETDLTGTDFIEADPGSGIEPDVVVTDINTAGNGFDQDAAVVGKYMCNSTLVFPLRNWGASDSNVLPDWATVLQCAGFSLTQNNGYYILTPVSNSIQDGTLWTYSGDLRASQSLLTKAGNLKFSPKFTLDFAGESIGKIEFTGVGRYGGAPTTATQPSVTKNRTAVPPLRSVTMEINGDSNYRCLNLEIDFNQDVDATTLPSDVSGVGKSEITTRKVKFTAKCYREITATVDPESAMFALTEGAINVSWYISNEIQILSGYSQITKVSPSEENGVQTWDIEGQLNRNDFIIRVLGGSSSSSSS